MRDAGARVGWQLRQASRRRAWQLLRGSRASASAVPGTARKRHARCCREPPRRRSGPAGGHALKHSELDAFDIHLFTLGGTSITLFTLLWSLLLAAAVVVLARLLRVWTTQRLLAHTGLDLGTRQAIGAVVRYTTLAVGFLAIVQTVGINLTTFNVLAGALAFGVGFGLQNLFSNFISGLIIMVDRPMKIGDRIEIAGVEGEVSHIGARRTTVVTDDRVAIIVPNQRFVTDNVVNQTYYETPVRVRLQFAVQHGVDARAVKKLALETALANRDVLRDPPPQVRLRGMAGNLQFELQVWNRTHVHRRDELLSALNYALAEALRAHEIKQA
jgi:small-conductance mechanosensitive channel